MEKKEMSYRKQIMYRYVLNGLCWIISGVCNCFEGRVFGIVSLIALALGTFFMISTFVKKRQAADEMALANLHQAVANACWIGQIILLLFYIVFSKALMGIIGIKPDLNPFFSGGLLAFLGLLNVMAGLFFKKLEDE